MQTAIIDNSKEWTVEEFRQLEESNLPCELINGELFISPAPNLTHQVVSSNLHYLLKTYSLKDGGFVAFSPFDVYFDRKNVFQPDLLYLRKENLSQLFEKGLNGAPE